jgi:hypothetical protein
MLGNAAHVNLEHMPAPARRATHTLRGQARQFGVALPQRHIFWNDSTPVKPYSRVTANGTEGATATLKPLIERDFLIIARIRNEKRARVRRPTLTGCRHLGLSILA